MKDAFQVLIGQSAITYYKVVSEFDDYSLVHCKLKTGRTHQIRVHMSYLSHPIIGDTLYGNTSDLINRQALHSYQITCVHPITKMPLTFRTDLPTDMANLI